MVATAINGPEKANAREEITAASFMKTLKEELAPIVHEKTNKSEGDLQHPKGSPSHGTAKAPGDADHP